MVAETLEVAREAGAARPPRSALQRPFAPGGQRWRLRTIAILALVVLLPLPLWAQSTLENPQPGSFQSGIGIISGWACEAEEITIETEDGGTGQRATWVAGYRTSRTDTMGVCGDANNGFGLTYNWNLLGDGVHRVRALADGVEFAQVTVTVTTLGTPFVQGAMREVSVPDFPAAGTDVVLRWQQAQQNFVITDGSPGQSGGTSGSPPRVLENPQPGSFQSGIGIISGWACEAEEITIETEDGGTGQRATWVAGYRTSRTDTMGVCGDANNGFGLTYNWNLLGDGAHRVRALADGVEFAQVTVTVTTLGTPFVQGAMREVSVPDFPAAGTDVVLRWQEAQQNFVITQTTSTPVSAHFLPDANLRRAVEKALGKPPGATITKAELATLRNLSASDNGIVDLTGLEFATNLTTLNLYSNAITDLTPLTDLTNLTTLNLYLNEIVDLIPLAGLTNLTRLGLGSNAITDLTPLGSGLTNLAGLGLASNAITDLTSLAGLTNLSGLNLYLNEIVDLIPLAGLTNLTWLALGFNAITDLTPLADLTNLTTLNLGFNAITDLTPLADLTNLTILNLGFNGIRDLTPLAGLTNLTNLTTRHRPRPDVRHRPRPSVRLDQAGFLKHRPRASPPGRPRHAHQGGCRH